MNNAGNINHCHMYLLIYMYIYISRTWFEYNIHQIPTWRVGLLCFILFRKTGKSSSTSSRLYGCCCFFKHEDFFHFLIDQHPLM